MNEDVRLVPGARCSQGCKVGDRVYWHKPGRKGHAGSWTLLPNAYGTVVEIGRKGDRHLIKITNHVGEISPNAYADYFVFAEEVADDSDYIDATNDLPVTDLGDTHPMSRMHPSPLLAPAETDSDASDADLPVAPMGRHQPGSTAHGYLAEAEPEDWQHYLDQALEYTVDGDTRNLPKWTFADWLQSLELTGALATKLAEYMTTDDPRVQISFLQNLGRHGSQAAVEKMLRDGDIIQVIASEIWKGARTLGSARAASAAELNDKFQQEGEAFGLTYGGVSIFFAGLEALVGSPDRQVEKTMQREHCESSDSVIEFITSNYNIATTSKAEWYFVKAPEDGPRQADFEEWPKEGRIPEGNVKCCRKPRPLASFSGELGELNRILANAREPEVIQDEVCGLRLYTGPMFMKYNTVLRGFANDLMKANCCKLCLDNTYTTTLHVINSGIVKTGKVMKATTVYRGIKDGILPENFWNFDEFNVRGGIEYAFMSTTTNRDVALDYVSSGSVGTIIEIPMGMIDRGADLSRFSQYPHEKEICFAPLTGMEVGSTRVEKDILVVQMRLSINLSALTIEQVLEKRAKVVADMCASLVKELHQDVRGTDWQDLAHEVGCTQLPSLVEDMVTKRLQSITRRPPTDFNDDIIMENAFREALAAVAAVRLQRAKVLEEVAECMQGGEADAVRATAAVYLTEESVARNITVSGGAPFGDLRNVRGGVLALLGLRLAEGELEPAPTQTYESTKGEYFHTLLTCWGNKRKADEEPLGPAWRLFKVNGEAGSDRHLQTMLHEVYSRKKADNQTVLEFNRPLTNQEASKLIVNLTKSLGKTDQDVARCSRRIRRFIDLSPHLSVLVVPKGTDLGDRGGKALARILDTNATIKECLLDNARIGEEAGQAFAKALETNTTIYKLVLNGNDLGDSAGGALARALRVNATISRLDLKYANLGDKAGEAFADALEKNTYLEWLSLDGNHLGEKAGKAFADVLQRNTTIKKLVLNGNRLGDNAAESIAKALRKNKTVTELFLDDNDIGQVAGEAFAKTLETNATLECLFLGNNHLGDKAGEAIANALRTNTALRQISLKHNDLGDTAGEAFGKALQRNATLLTLGLSENHLGDTTGEALAIGLEMNTSSSIDSMKLSSNNFSDRTGKAFANLLEKKTSITTLWLQDNDIGRSGVEALIRAVEKNTTIQGIHFDTDSLSEAAKASLNELARFHPYAQHQAYLRLPARKAISGH